MYRYVLLSTVLSQFSLLVFNAVMTSPAQDEPGNLVAGLTHLRTGSFELYRVNPPLTRIVGSLPVIIQSPREDQRFLEVNPISRETGSRPIFQLGADFVQANGSTTLVYIRSARIALIPFACIGTVICFFFARDLFGEAAGCLSAVLWAFHPMVLGHGCLLSSDVPAATASIGVCYVFFRWMRTAVTIDSSLFLGVVFGIALLIKFTVLVLVPSVLALIFINRIARPKDQQDSTRRRITFLGLSMLVSLFVVNIGYLGEGSFRRLGDFEFVSRSLGGGELERGRWGNRFEEAWLSSCPVPLPENFVLGLDVQQRDFEQPRLPNYLFGENRRDGWYSYYLWGLFLKSPFAFAMMLIFRLLIGPCRSTECQSLLDECILIIPATAVLLAASLKTGMNQHVRYVVPALPFFCVWASGIIAGPLKCFFDTWNARKVLVPAMLLLYVGESLIVFPHSLGFFHFLAGGPKQGPQMLLGSNVDWGQDLLWLRRWRQDHPNLAGRQTFLAFEGQYNPFEILSEEFDAWPSMDASESVPADASFAIASNILYEVPVSTIGTDGRFTHINRRPFERLRSTEPIGWAGYSIRVFSAEQVRRAFED